jgi:hypothetical protein
VNLRRALWENNKKFMNKRTVMLAMIIGSTIGSYLPVLFGAGLFSFTTIFCGFLGGVAGIWLTTKSYY